MAELFQTIAGAGASLGSAIESHIDDYFRTMLVGDGCASGPGFVRLMLREPHPFANFVLLTRTDDADAAEEAFAPLCAYDGPSAVLHPTSVGGAGGTGAGVGIGTSAVSAALRERLAARGFQPAEEMPAMGVDLDRLAVPPLPEGCAFIEAGAEHDGPWCDALAEGYGMPRSTAGKCGPAAAARLGAADRVRCFGVMKDGAFIATSSVFLHGGYAGVYCVSTLAAERGKGLGAFITAKPLELCRAMGYRAGVLQASEMGAPVYRRLGFETFGAVVLHVRGV